MLQESCMSLSNELTRSNCYEIFSHATGVEISPAVRSHEERGVAVERSGRIQLRFFKLSPKINPDDVTQIRFICEPDEAFELSLKLSSVASSPVPCKEKLNPHKFSTGDPAVETVTTVTAEKWERNGKSGYALTVGRGRDFISVPVPLSKILFAAEFLRYLSTDQCWVERQDKAFPKKSS